MQSAINSLIRRANLRLRVQRALEVLATACLPALIVLAIAVLLAKAGWWGASTVVDVAIALGAGVGAATLVAAAWPIAPLATLLRLDEGNRFRDRLGSAWAFLQLPEAERTPEMRLHIERTQARLGEVKAAPAYPFRRPKNLVPAAVLSVVTAFVAVLVEPKAPPLPPVAEVEPVPRMIVDMPSLAPELRRLEELEELAALSGDPELIEVQRRLSDVVDRLRRGAISEDELFDALEAVEGQLAEIGDEPPPDLSPELADMADQLREIAEEQGLAEEAAPIIEALQEGDEGAVADALEQLAEVLEQEELTPEEQEELAEALEQLADLFDPTDPAIRELLEDLADQIADLEARFAESGRSRDQRQLEELRQRFSQAQADAEGQQGEQGPAEQTRQEVSDALADAAQELREGDPAETGEQPEQPANEPQPGEEGEAQGEPQEGEPQEGEPGEGEPRESETAQGEPEEGEPREPQEGEQEPGEEETAEGQEPREGEPQQGETPESQQPGEGEAAETGAEPQEGQPGEQPGAPPEGEQQAGAQPQEGAPQEQGSQQGQEQGSQQGQRSASDAIREAAEQLRDTERQEAAQEGRELAEQATEGIRENLQRSSQDQSGDPEDQEQQAEEQQSWEDFMARAEGEAPEAGEESQPEQPPGEASEPPGTEGERGEGQWGTEAGGDPLGEASTDIESEGERVTEQGEESGAEGDPSTRDVIEAAAAEGFATREYQEVYQEYARAAEAALEAEEVPVGFNRFVRRYFDLIQPRVAGAE